MRVSVQGGVSVEVPSGSGRTLLEVLEDAGARIEAACGGFAACNTCRVRVVSGADVLTPLRDEEQPFLDHPSQRLACCCEAVGDVVVVLEPGR